MAAPLVLGGLSGGALALGAGGIFGLGYLVYHVFFKPKEGEAAIAEATQAYTHVGPRGELVFNRDPAQGILRSLSGQSYSYPEPGNEHLVEIHPERGGAPAASSLNAATWFKTQNRRMSILAPVYLPMPTSADRFLRLSAPGHEAELAADGYAVLAYALAHHRRVPGQPVTGLPPAQPQRQSPIPTPVSNAYAELPPSMHGQLTRILRNPVRPDAGLALANELARSGLNAAAEVIGTKAMNSASQAALGMPLPPPVPLPAASGDPVAQHWGRLDLPGPVLRHALQLENASGSVVAMATLSPAVQKALALLGLPPTFAGLQAFQSAHGLPASGVIDAATQAAMQMALASALGQNTSSSGQAVAGDADRTRTVQRALVKLNLLPFFALTGEWDEPTRRAIRSFQSARGLPANGMLDDQTATLLAASAAATPSTLSGMPTLPRQNISMEPFLGPSFAQAE